MTSSNHFCVHPETHLKVADSHGDNPRTDPSPCGACHCHIAGSVYHCAACNSDLHPFCKSLPQHLSSPLHPAADHPLRLISRDPHHLINRQCAVCSEDITGVHYTCPPCRFDVHPQCSQLPPILPHGPEPGHALILQMGDDSHTAGCSACGNPCGRWAYRCYDCSVNIHFWCLVQGACDDAADEADPTTTTTTRGIFRLRRRDGGDFDDNLEPAGRRYERVIRFVGVVAASILKSIAVDLILDGLLNMGN